MKTVTFKILDIDLFYGDTAEVKAPRNSTKQEVLDIFFKQNKCDSKEGYEIMISSKYLVSSDELGISNL